jgi:toxin CcdB
MAQFDVHRNANPVTARDIPYLLDIQNDLLWCLSTRVIAPLERAEIAQPIKRLNPVFMIDGQSVVMATGDLAALHRRDLGAPIASLDSRRDDIVAALDFLITGF